MIQALALALALTTGPLAPALQAVGWALLHLVWQGTAIAAVLALLLVLLPSRRADLRYAISCAALLLVVVVGVLTGLRSYAASEPQGAPVHLAHAQPAVARSMPAPPSVTAIVVATFAPARVATLPDPWRAASDALPAVVSLWLAGVTLLSLRLLVQWLRTRRLVHEHAQPACEPWLAMAHRLAHALGVRHAVRLLESTVVQVPAVIGLFRPVILLPANTLTGLMPGQLEMILAHELAHIRRHDFLANLLQAVVETLLFYHPAVWWISRQVRMERENCCDDLAVSVCGNPLQYARALTRLEELRAETLALALSAGGGTLLGRIRRVVGGQAATPAPVRGVTALALLVCLLLAFAGPSLSAIAKPQPGTTAATAASAPAFELRTQHTTTRTLHFTRTLERTSTTEKEKVKEKDKAKDDGPDPSPSPEPTPAVAPEADGAGSDAEVANTNADIASGRMKLTVDELIALRSQNVTTADILDMRFLFADIDLRDIAGMYAVGATPEYVRKMRAAGLDVRSAREAQGMAAVGVTPEFVRDMRAAGLEVESAGEASSLAAVGVTSEFIRGMRAAGLQISSAEQAQGLAAVGVTPEFVRDMRAAGLPVATASEAQGLAAVGVTPEFVRDMRAAGVAIRDAKDAQSLAAVGVSPKFVRKLARAGYTNLSVSDLCRLGAAGVSDSFIDDMRQYRTH
jgi:beta-lactamase regulating signal transducer with metallopeptidase domain